MLLVYLCNSFQPHRTGSGLRDPHACPDLRGATVNYEPVGRPRLSSKLTDGHITNRKFPQANQPDQQSDIWRMAFHPIR